MPDADAANLLTNSNKFAKLSDNIITVYIFDKVLDDT